MVQQVVRRRAKDIAFMRRAIQKMQLRQGQTNARLFKSRGRDDQQWEWDGQTYTVFSRLLATNSTIFVVIKICILIFENDKNCCLVYDEIN